ncbi:MAG: DUF819 family protein [Bacteroidales bacterium]|nr:DUF819 family protein [Bacteroidales bacterium]
MDTLVVGVIYILGPLMLLYGCKKSVWLNKFGTVGLAYVLGIILSNIGLIKPEMKSMQENFTSVTIALALPLLLFSINIRQWSRLALKTGLAVLLGIISVLLIIVIGNYFLKDIITESWKVSGLMAGVYIGATANMAAIKVALNVDEETFILVNAYDILICIPYFFFLITIAQKVLGKALIPFKPMDSKISLENEMDDFDGWDSFRGIHNKRIILPLLLALLLSGAVVGISLFLKQFFPADYQTAGMIVGITAISIFLSLIPAVNKIKKTFQSGMYLIVIFCIVVGSFANFSMFTTKSLYMAAFVAIVVFGSLFFLVLFSRIFKIDTDTTIIASTAFIFSPPFVPTVANALRNKEIILSGITIGIIGYATANFLGITLAYFLR